MGNKQNQQEIQAITDLYDTLRNLTLAILDKFLPEEVVSAIEKYTPGDNTYGEDREKIKDKKAEEDKTKKREKTIDDFNKEIIAELKKLNTPMDKKPVNIGVRSRRQNAQRARAGVGAGVRAGVGARQ